MSTKRFFVITMMLTAMWACSNKEDKQDDATEIYKIKALSAARAKAFNEADADIIAEAFTETGMLLPPGTKSMVGRHAVRKYYQDIFDQYKTFLESGYEAVKVSGNIGYGIGYAKVKLVPHNGGDTLVSTAKYINILQRQDNGSWLTTHDIWNGNE